MSVVNLLDPFNNIIFVIRHKFILQIRGFGIALSIKYPTTFKGWLYSTTHRRHTFYKPIMIQHSFKMAATTCKENWGKSRTPSAPIVSYGFAPAKDCCDQCFFFNLPFKLRFFLWKYMDVKYMYNFSKVINGCISCMYQRTYCVRRTRRSKWPNIDATIRIPNKGWGEFFGLKHQLLGGWKSPS